MDKLWSSVGKAAILIVVQFSNSSADHQLMTMKSAMQNNLDGLVADLGTPVPVSAVALRRNVPQITGAIRSPVTSDA